MSNVCCLTAFALLLGISRVAGAQTDEQRAAARSLATEGLSAFNEGRYADSLDRFSRAESLVHAPTHLLYLARSQEKLGHLVLAQESYLKILKEPLPANAPQAFVEARASAEQERRALEPRIGSLTLNVTGAEGIKDLNVTLDGAQVAAVLIGVARPIDPGDHQITASAPGYRPQTSAVHVADGERKALTLRLEPDPNAPLATSQQPTAAPGAAPAGAGNVGTAGGAWTATPPPSPQSNALRIGSYVAYGVGAVGLGVGTIFLVQSHAKRSDADTAYAACTRVGGCYEGDPAAQRTSKLDDQARRALTVSIVGFAAFGVGAVAGTALLLTSMQKEQERPTAALSVSPWIGFRAAGLTGRF